MDAERQPWWMVTAVFDPDGNGADFSYTEGLATAGLPELHVWARPSLGEDPGLDWRFSQRDTCRLLNEMAWRLLDGRLAVGDTWTERYDEGLVEARFSVHPPVSAADVDAFGAGDAPVLPVKWELHRPPVGRPQALTEAAQAEAEADYCALVPRRLRAPLPPGWELPSIPSWGPDERFGPRTPLVLARATSWWGGSVDDWITLAEHVVVGHDAIPTGYARAVSASAAREAGRVAAIERIEAAVDELMTGFGRTWGARQHAAVRAWFGEGLDTGPELEHSWNHLLDDLGAALATHLVVESVADLLPDRVVRLGQGPVLAALAPPGLAPDDRWLCSASVGRAVTELVARTPVAALVEAAAAWDPIIRDQPGAPLLLATWTSAGCCRPVFEMLEITASVTAQIALESRGLDIGALQVWATSLATVLTERAALDPAVVELFLRASRRVPGLADLVNSPLTTEAA